MRLPLAFAAAALLAAGCTPYVQGRRISLGGPDREREEDVLRADPSKVVATELAFARAAQEKGQWTAFAEYSTDQAVMFVPEPVNAHSWLSGRANPAQAVMWQPHQVWSSCDGSLAVTKGAWQRPNGTVGYFTTVWERQRDGGYKWVLDQGDQLEQALAQPEMIGGKVAECATPGGPPRGQSQPASIRPTACDGGTCRGGGSSGDGTLTYEYATTAAGRQFTARLRDANGGMAPVLRTDVAAE
jgi:hypothetical protein